MNLADTMERLRRFAQERDWDQFHTPKNLVMALSGEVGELNELFQWLTPDQSRSLMDNPVKAEAVRDELADILSYCLRLADQLGVDLEAALVAKMAKNASKYPVHLAKGSAAKYTELSPKSRP